MQVAVAVAAGVDGIGPEVVDHVRLRVDFETIAGGQGVDAAKLEHAFGAALELAENREQVGHDDIVALRLACAFCRGGDAGDVAEPRWRIRRKCPQLILEAAPKTKMEVIDRFCDAIDGNPLILRLYLGLDVIRRDISDGLWIQTQPCRQSAGECQRCVARAVESASRTARLALAIVSMQGPDFHPGFLERAAIDLNDFDAFRVGSGRRRQCTDGSAAGPRT